MKLGLQMHSKSIFEVINLHLFIGIYFTKSLQVNLNESRDVQTKLST